MKIINPKKDFGIEYFDVGDIDVVNQIIQQINIENNNQVKLNFQECITDYPATSKIIDKVLVQLNELPGNKSLIITLGLADDAVHLLNGLFFGSEFLEIQEDSEILPLEKMKTVIYQKIVQAGINITIMQVDNKTGKVINTYYES